MCKSGTMCCSFRKAISSKLQIIKERIRMGKWCRGWGGGKLFSAVTAQLFGVLRHSSPTSRGFSFPAKKRDPGKDSKI